MELNNPGILKHFELLVKLYASPKYDEIDPTVLIFPTFLFFFGLMITDAMYGVMCLVLGIFILRGAGKYYDLYKPVEMRDREIIKTRKRYIQFGLFVFLFTSVILLYRN